MVQAKKIAVPELPLNSGFKQPALGLGTYNDDRYEAVRGAVKHALKVGYRAIDTAAAYGTEGPVGEGIKDSGVDRSEIFITTKVWNNNHRAQDVVKSVKESLKNLQTDYIDLLLIHWPLAFKPGDDLNPKDSNGKVITANIPLSETWGAFEKLVEEKVVRSIGVSNFNEHFIDEILKTAKITPSVNQIELHPYLQRKELVKYCQDRGIQITAYSPFGNLNTVSQGIPNVGKLVDDEVLVKIGKKYNVPSTTIILSWAVSRGVAVIPKSTNNHRIEENFLLIELDQEDINQITTLDRGLRFVFTEKLDWNSPELDVFKMT